MDVNLVVVTVLVAAYYVFWRYSRKSRNNGNQRKKYIKDVQRLAKKASAEDRRLNNGSDRCLF